ncbi:CHAT domain-containing protein [Algoriphagus litoralis]|uniref:CHAT domain-containing protein n=1 Tax=Algoriphagus litoralis TaxID=2202829 RepID=UPI0013002A9E|nr:CHAT domain-containing tetratricopeptide repeat protein [Algoriphagus litoralis]
MPKLSLFFYWSLSVILLLLQTDSKIPESKETPPTAFSQRFEELKNQRQELSPEILLPEIEKMEQQIQSGVQKASSGELLEFYVLYLEILGLNYQAKKGLELALKVEELPELQALTPSSWAHFYATQGFLLDELGQTAKAVQTYEKSIELYENDANPEFQTFAETYNKLGFAYYNLGFQNKAIFNYHQAFEILKDHLLSDHRNMTEVVRNLFYVEYEYGNEQGSTELVNFFDGYIKTASLTDTIGSEDIQYMKINQYLNKSRLLELLRDSVGMIELVDEVDYFMRTLDPDFSYAHRNYQLSVYESAGTLFTNITNYGLSKSYYQKMSKIPLDNFYQMKYAANLAMVNYYDSAFTQSLEYADESLKLLEAMGYRGSSTYTVMILKSELLNNLGRAEESRDLIVKIYSELLERPLTEADLQGLDYQEFEGMNTDRHITIMIRSGNIYRELFKKSGDASDFERAFNFYKLAAQMFHEYYLKGSYTAWLEKLNKEIEGGLLSLLAEPDRFGQDTVLSTLNLLERNASQELWKKFISKNEESLGKTAERISEYNLKQMELENLADSLQVEKKELELALEKLEQAISSERTFGFYSGEDFDLRDFQKSIPEDEQVLKYYVADAEVFGVLLNSNEVQVRRLGKAKELEEQVNQFRKSILNIDDKYSSHAPELYQDILSPFSIQEGKRLQIIPDDFLHLLPFEALSESGADFLIEKIPIAYQHSYKLLNYRNPVKSKFNPDFLIGFAPSYEGTQFSSIENNLEETERIVSYHSGEAKVGQEASKRNFVASLANYRIHHLAMHTEQQETNYDQSALVFSNAELLKLDELYRMNFPSELVVLSACNTGVGQMMPGEGLSSLSRALTFSGVKSSVYSLWEVPDKETSELMIFFYEEIKKGIPKDQALAQAKRRFLSEYPLKNHPIFWAGFVINGQLDPIQASLFPAWMGIVSGLILVVLILLFWFKRAKKP